MRRRFLTSILILTLILGAGVSSASACLNDRETKTREAEFQAQYTSQSISAESSFASNQGYGILDYVLVGSGIILGMTGLGAGLGAGIMATRKAT